MDQIVTSMNERFLKNQNICKDFACLDPNNFKEICEKVPENALDGLAVLLQKFKKEISKDLLQSELRDFAEKWEKFKDLLNDNRIDQSFNSMNYDSEFESESEVEPEDNVNSEVEDENDIKKKCKTSKNCKQCILCCFQVLTKFKLHTLAYSNLYLAYKFVLTLPFTQVSCERSFSKLKYILNRLRNSLNQEHLEAFMIMSCEKDLLTKIKNDDVIDYVAEQSTQLKQLLLHN